MAEIPIPQTSEDVYSYGFDKSLNRDLNGTSTGVVYDAIEDALNAGQVLSGGNLNLKTLTIGGLTRQVAPGDDIQGAIDAVNREGGGTVQLLAKTYLFTSKIVMKANVTLNGAGRDVTVLDFNGASIGIEAKGTSSDILKNWAITNLTITNSNASAAIDIDNADFWRMESVRTTSCDQIGMRIDRSQFYRITNYYSDNNTGVGTHLKETSGHAHFSGLFVGCLWDRNLSDNVLVDSGVSNVQFIGCVNQDADGDGYEISGTSISIIGGDVGGNGFVSGSDINVTTTAQKTIITGVDTGASATDTNTNTAAVYTSNSGQQKVILMFNYSGDTIPAGSPVILDATDFAGVNSASGTTTHGDQRIWGMALESVSDTSVFDVLVDGRTTLLRVNNSASSIAIGDYLSTYSHSYYAKKAIAGEVAFAIALTAPTTSTAQITALII